MLLRSVRRLRGETCQSTRPKKARLSGFREKRPNCLLVVSSPYFCARIEVMRVSESREMPSSSSSGAPRTFVTSRGSVWSVWS